MLNQINGLEQKIIENIGKIKEENELVNYKNEVFGKSGEFTNILKGIKDLDDEQKRTIGKTINDKKNSLQEKFEERLSDIRKETIKTKLQNEFFDVTIPGNEQKTSHVHPLTKVLFEVIDSFKRMGFDVYESREITTEYLNFDAVNVPATHPARDMQDTFWLEGKGNVLSTQTSSMQNVILKSKKPPIKCIIPGRVFRNEAIDARHENTFYQVEGLVVDSEISMANLKHTIKTMLSDLFGKEVTIRMRPGYFPFVEPGVEVDFSCTFCDGNKDSKCRVCKGSGWIEFMGAGLIHPKVLIEGGLDPEKYTGFAFGFGLNRLVMIKYGINDIRYFQNPNINFLKQF
ncbi:MAG: phenylalanine--tRNA ligase subunit alpha [Candidatus Gracilibacteria bacterium]|nr:phenylalanine--tRNA ligase subunit alpha [Candidatus Gracilibacteria bacterium]